MKKDKPVFNYFFVVCLKLAFLGLLVLLINTLLLYGINRYLLPGTDADIQLPLFFGFLAVFVFIVYCLCHWPFNNLGEVLSHTTYNPYMPLPWLIPKAKKSKNIDIDKIVNTAMPGDVILRRHKYYLVGLAFSQNSYFTHVGICYKAPGNDAMQVLHSEGKKGVHMLPIEEFCKCSNVAILRFSLDDTPEDMDVMDDLNEQELKLFAQLQNLKKGIDNDTMDDGKTFREHYLKVMLDKAVSLIGKRYDKNFDFGNIDAVSCIEYVWACYQCLFPLHRIRVKYLRYFYFIRLWVIIPDGFVKNDYFSYQYCSIPKVNTKRQLLQHIKKVRHNYWFFLISVLLWNGILMTGIWLIKDYYPAFPVAKMFYIILFMFFILYLGHALYLRKIMDAQKM